MASVRKHGNKWQARIQRRDQPSLSKSFLSKADALKWARNIESQLDLGTFAPRQAMPRLRLMVERYVDEVTPTKKGSTQERYRAGQIKKTNLADMLIDRIDGAAISTYRDQRLKEVSNNTVRLELAFLSVVFEQCRREWGWVVSNPVKQIRMPKPGGPFQHFGGRLRGAAIHRSTYNLWVKKCAAVKSVHGFENHLEREEPKECAGCAS